VTTPTHDVALPPVFKASTAHTAHLHRKHALEGVFEPLLGILLSHALPVSDLPTASTALGNTVARALQHNVEIHAENTSGRVILYTEIDVLLDAKSKASSLAEVVILKLVLFDAEAPLQQVPGEVASDSHVRSDLLVTTDTELTHSVPSLGLNGVLALSKCLQHTRGISEAITSFSGGDVQHQLLNSASIIEVGKGNIAA